MSIFDENGWYKRHPAETGSHGPQGFSVAVIVGIILAIVLLIWFKGAR